MFDFVLRLKNILCLITFVGYGILAWFVGSNPDLKVFPLLLEAGRDNVESISPFLKVALPGLLVIRYCVITSSIAFKGFVCS